MNNQAAGSRQSLYGTAYAFMIVATVILAFGLVPMAWCIPMTLRTKRARDEAGTGLEAKHTALGVCSIFFMSWDLFGFVAGILILIASGKFHAN